LPVIPTLQVFYPSLLAAALVFSPACSSNLFSDYPETAQSGLRAFSQGRFAAAARQFEQIQEADDDDAFLAYAEAGMVWHVAGQPAKAIETWHKAEKSLEEFTDRPTISGRSIVESIGSVLVNEKSLPYDGEDFEIALLHGFLAWDYLRMGNLDDAMVEVLQSYQIQNNAEERYAKEYGMNRFSRFVAAITQEVDANFDEAEIDLKQLEEEVPGHPAIEMSLQRILRLQSTEAKAELGLAQLVVVHESGHMPIKVSSEFRYSTRRSAGRVSLPKFGTPRSSRSGLLVGLDKEPIGQTEVLEDVLQVARTNLDDRMAWVLTRSIGRSAAKTILIDQVAEKVTKDKGEGLGFLVSVVGSLLQFATEKADLRSWITLPQTIEVFRASVEPGDHELAVQLPGQNPIKLGIYSFRPGRPVLVTVRSYRGRAYAQVGPIAITDTPQS
jgi:uncharacterized protein